MTNPKNEVRGLTAEDVDALAAEAEYYGMVAEDVKVFVADWRRLHAEFERRGRSIQAYRETLEIITEHVNLARESGTRGNIGVLSAIDRTAREALRLGKEPAL